MRFLIGSSIIMIPVLPKKMHWEKRESSHNFVLCLKGVRSLGKQLRIVFYYARLWCSFMHPNPVSFASMGKRGTNINIFVLGFVLYNLGLSSSVFDKEAFPICFRFILFYLCFQIAHISSPFCHLLYSLQKQKPSVKIIKNIKTCCQNIKTIKTTCQNHQKHQNLLSFIIQPSKTKTFCQNHQKHQNLLSKHQNHQNHLSKSSKTSKPAVIYYTAFKNKNLLSKSSKTSKPAVKTSKPSKPAVKIIKTYCQ